MLIKCVIISLAFIALTDAIFILPALTASSAATVAGGILALKGFALGALALARRRYHHRHRHHHGRHHYHSHHQHPSPPPHPPPFQPFPLHPRGPLHGPLPPHPRGPPLGISPSLFHPQGPHRDLPPTPTPF